MRLKILLAGNGLEEFYAVDFASPFVQHFCELFHRDFGLVHVVTFQASFPLCP